MLFVGLTHLAPEAFAAGDVERIFLLGGAGVGILLEVIFRARNLSSPATEQIGAWLGIVGLGLHSTLDGAVYTAVFWHNHASGLMASAGLILHEAPEGIVAMALALRAGLKPPVAAVTAVLASSVTTPLGWIIAHAIGESGQGVMQIMFAASAGLLLYVGWHMIAGGIRSLRRT
jgi:zinc transporter ZupT